MCVMMRADCSGSRIVLPDDDLLWIVGGISFAFKMRKNGAASVIRTRDLTLTKGALYRWSYGSIRLVLRRHAMQDKFWCMLPQKICAVTSSLAEI